MSTRRRYSKAAIGTVFGLGAVAVVLMRGTLDSPGYAQASDAACVKCAELEERVARIETVVTGIFFERQIKEDNEAMLMKSVGNNYAVRLSQLEALLWHDIDKAMADAKLEHRDAGEAYDAIVQGEGGEAIKRFVVMKLLLDDEHVDQLRFAGEMGEALWQARMRIYSEMNSLTPQSSTEPSPR